MNGRGIFHCAHDSFAQHLLSLPSASRLFGVQVFDARDDVREDGQVDAEEPVEGRVVVGHYEAEHAGREHGQLAHGENEAARLGVDQHYAEQRQTAEDFQEHPPRAWEEHV